MPEPRPRQCQSPEFKRLTVSDYYCSGWCLLFSRLFEQKLVEYNCCVMWRWPYASNDRGPPTQKTSIIRESEVKRFDVIILCDCSSPHHYMYYLYSWREPRKNGRLRHFVVAGNLPGLPPHILIRSTYTPRGRSNLNNHAQSKFKQFETYTQICVLKIFLK